MSNDPDQAAAGLIEADFAFMRAALANYDERRSANDSLVTRRHFVDLVPPLRHNEAPRIEEYYLDVPRQDSPLSFEQQPMQQNLSEVPLFDLDLDDGAELREYIERQDAIETELESHMRWFDEFDRRYEAELRNDSPDQPFLGPDRQVVAFFGDDMLLLGVPLRPIRRAACAAVRRRSQQ